MKEKFAGQALALGNNIDTDQSYPGRYLALTNPEEIGSHCLEGCLLYTLDVYKRQT